MKNRGFTLIELILVIAILGILAVSAMPKIFSITNEANIAAGEGVVANVLVGITLYGSKQMASTGVERYPSVLDSVGTNTNCSSSNVCFADVVKDGVTRDWKKQTSTKYQHIPTTNVFEYDSANGTFLQYVAPEPM